MIFQLVQTNLSLLGIGKLESARSFRIKVLIGCLLLGTNIILHLKFFFNEANTFQQYVESTFVSSIAVVGLWCYASLILKRIELLEFIDNCENLIHQFKETLNDDYPSVVMKILNAAHLSEQCSKIIYLVVGQLTPIVCLPKPCYSLYCYYVGDLESDAFELSDRTLWFPFDWKNPLGYSIAAVIQTIMITYLLFVVANLLSFGIGCYLIGITATKEINNILRIADKRLRLKKERSLAMERFTDLIKWHSLVKQLLNDFSDMFQPLFMVAFIWSTLAICITLLLIQLETLDPIMMVYLSVDVCYGFGFVFAICELCQRVCDGFEEMNKTMDQFHWPSYPIGVQRLLIIVIIFTQQPVEFRVFGSFVCCRDSFKRVVNSAFSYFMVIRRFF